MKKRKTVLIVISAVVVALGVSAIIFRPSPPSIPQFDRARFTGLLPEGIQILEISESDLAQISPILKSTQRDLFPMKWAYLGTLELGKNGTTVSTIEIFTNPGGPGPLQISKEYYLGYDQEAFRNILSRAVLRSNQTSDQQSKSSSK